MIQRSFAMLSVAMAGMLLAGAVVSSLAAGETPAPATHFDFEFGAAKAAADRTAVMPEMVYSKERGFGFEPGAAVQAIHRGSDAARGNLIASDKPFLFSVAVPEGNYQVTVTLGASGSGIEDDGEG